jgi:hypothetical protein
MRCWSLVVGRQLFGGGKSIMFLVILSGDLCREGPMQ